MSCGLIFDCGQAAGPRRYAPLGVRLRMRSSKSFDKTNAHVALSSPHSRSAWDVVRLRQGISRYSEWICRTSCWIAGVMHGLVPRLLAARSVDIVMCSSSLYFVSAFRSRTAARECQASGGEVDTPQFRQDSQGAWDSVPSNLGARGAPCKDSRSGILVGEAAMNLARMAHAARLQRAPVRT